MFQYLADIEEHLNVTIQQVDPEINVPVNDFDGKVTYGEKKLNAGKCHYFFKFSHTNQLYMNITFVYCHLQPAVKENLIAQKDAYHHTSLQPLYFNQVLECAWT